MKKLLPIAIIAFASAMTFSSCKKDYTCTCKLHQDAYTDTTGGFSVSYPAEDTTFSTSLGKQKKSDAQSACTAEGTTYKTLYGAFNSNITVNCGI